MFKIKKQLKNVVQIAVFPLVLFSLNSCATIVGDNGRTVSVTSHPQGAGIYVDGQRHGTTPAHVTLPSYVYGGKTLVLKKEGYQEQAAAVNAKFQPCGLWNILFWPGFLIDGATGSTVKLDPANLNVVVDLQPVEAPHSNVAVGLQAAHPVNLNEPVDDEQPADVANPPVLEQA